MQQDALKSFGCGRIVTDCRARYFVWFRARWRPRQGCLPRHRRNRDGLGRDGRAWKRLMGPLAHRADHVAQFTGSQVIQLPRHPATTILFGTRVLEQGLPTWNLRLREDAARALLTGVGAHAIGSMPSLSAVAVALSLGAYAHTRGWSIPIGGSQAIVDAMAADLIDHGGSIVTAMKVQSIEELPSSQVVLFDTSSVPERRIA